MSGTEDAPLLLSVLSSTSKPSVSVAFRAARFRTPGPPSFRGGSALRDLSEIAGWDPRALIEQDTH